MRRFKKLVIGGIENKLFNLILLTVVLLTAAFAAVSAYHNNLLTDLAAESGEEQQASIVQITDTVMDAVVDQSMGRTTALQAHIADELFKGVKSRVEMLNDYAGKLLSNPGAYARMPWAEPDRANEGRTAAQLIAADGVNLEDPALRDKIGLIANMSDLMASLYDSEDSANSCFIALPEGVFLVTDDRSGAKFDARGNLQSFDACSRFWYKQAVEEGGLVFTDVETDAFTGDVGIVCAMPVYVDGELAAVVGSDLFLSSMQEYVKSSSQENNYICVINQHGHVVFSPRTEGVFRVTQSSEAEDLRTNGNAELAALVTEAMRGRTPMRLVQLEDGGYYMLGVPMPTVGWTVIAVCSQESVGQPAAMLQQSFGEIQEKVSSVYQEKTGKSKETAMILLILVAALMLTGSLILGKRIVRPLNTITKRISEIDEEHLEFKMEDSYRTGDEVEELAESFAAISHKTVEYLDTVQRVTAEKERIGTELALATQIQEAMLPHIVPAFPDRKDFDIIGHMDPAKEVGGDFYDYFLVDDDHLCMLIADVSGKGVPAALFMMASKIILQSMAKQGDSPAEILTKTNGTICSSNEAQMFVTVWIGILELSTGRLTCGSAGHEYPVFKQPGGRYELFKDRHGFVIGGMEGVRYREYSVQLEPGARLFVYTDGVPEATNGEKELFGTTRMIEALNEVPEAGPMEVLKHVRQAVDSFVREAEQFDDLTMLCLEYRGPGGAAQAGSAPEARAGQTAG